MCGIAGFTESIVSNCDASAVLERMGNALRHRGPDAGAQYLDHFVGLRHQRLSIIDTSEQGLQPMTSASGRYVTVFNGEIYNFMLLREELQDDGVHFRGTSDTEVLLALYEKMGPEFLQRLNGMFALAIWDKKDRSLFLARDRLGKKPLYYYQSGDRFAFASELKALLLVPGIDRKIRMDAMRDYFTYQYVPDPKSILENVLKLRPGHWMKVDSAGTREECYWDLSFADRNDAPEEELKEQLYALLKDSVRLRMVSDVPLGAFLSGGVDSSAVVGLMAAQSSSKVSTCSVGFDTKEFDETRYAEKVADLFSTDHRTFTVSGDIEKKLLDVAALLDEPFADASFLPTYIVSKMARKRVTVALAGDGGDENFAGYTKYLVNAREQKWCASIPSPVLNGVLRPLAGLLPDFDYPPARRASNMINSLAATPGYGFFICNRFFSNDIWDSLTGNILRDSVAGYDPAEVSLRHYRAADTDCHLSRTLYTDIKTYLPGDILTKVDRMSMANSLECRAPMLDYRVVEFAASLAPEYKIHDGVSKYILKKAFEPMLPDDILYRKKMGFSSPIAIWLRQGLRVAFEQHVFAHNSFSSEYFNKAALERIWRMHLAGSNIAVSELWSIFMFEIWWRNYIVQ